MFPVELHFEASGRAYQRRRLCQGDAYLITLMRIWKFTTCLFGFFVIFGQISHISSFLSLSPPNQPIKSISS